MIFFFKEKKFNLKKKIVRLKRQRSPENFRLRYPLLLLLHWPRTEPLLFLSHCFSFAEIGAVRHGVGVGGVGQFAGRSGSASAAASAAMRDEIAVDVALLGDAGGGAGADHDGGGDRRGVRPGVRRAQ